VELQELTVAAAVAAAAEVAEAQGCRQELGPVKLAQSVHVRQGFHVLHELTTSSTASMSST
jgi:hypothetical protein